MASIIAAQHHEHWDGNGQPKQLQGAQIDIAARIVSLVDVIDALGRDKSYRPAFSQQEIAQFIREKTGTQFDPDLAPMALELLDDFQKIRVQHGEV